VYKVKGSTWYSFEVVQEWTVYLNTIRTSCVSIFVDQKEGKFRNTENFKLMYLCSWWTREGKVPYVLLSIENEKAYKTLLLSEVGRTVLLLSCVDLQLSNDPCQTSSAQLVSLIAWGWLLLCFVELHLFHHLMNYIKRSDLMFWSCSLCLLLVF